MLNVVLGGVLDGRLLLAHARQNDGLWWDAVFKHQAYFSLADEGEKRKKAVWQMTAESL